MKTKLSSSCFFLNFVSSAWDHNSSLPEISYIKRIHVSTLLNRQARKNSKDFFLNKL